MDAAPASPTPRLRFLLRFVALAALFSTCAAWLHIALHKPVGIDDANIFMTYAKHFAEGHGFVYHPGGERVEGFSSFLYVLVLSAFFLVSDAPEHVLYLFNIGLLALAFSWITLALDQRYGKRFSPQSALLLAWVCASPSYLLWTITSLMESGLWSFLILSTVALGWRILDRGASRNTVLAACAVTTAMVLTRPEAMVFAGYQAVLFGWLLWARQARPGMMLAPFATFAATQVGLVLFRVAYFGFPFPNTYYAKVSPDKTYNFLEGFFYLRDFVLYDALMPVMLIAVIGLLGSAARRWNAPRSDELLRPLVSCGYVPVLFGVILIVGGDLFPGFRFTIPFWPLFALALLPWFSRLPHRHHWTAAVVLAVALPFTADVRWKNVPRQQPVDFQLMFNMAVSGRNNGHQLNRLFPGKKPSVGVVATGGIGLIYEGEVVDLMGLNNVRMAHAPGDRKGLKAHSAFNADVFFELSPDLLLPRWNDNPGLEPMNDHWANTVALRGLLDEPRFKAAYDLVTLSGPAAEGYRHLHAYARKDVIQALSESGVTILRAGNTP